MNKYKLISIIEGIIIIILLTILILPNSKKADMISQKSYLGIYHTNNYSQSNNGYKEANIVLNEDNTCSLPSYSNSKIYNCNYKELSQDKLEVIISTYIAYNNSATWDNNFGSSMKLSNNEENCEEKLKELKAKEPNNYKEFTKCMNVEEKVDIILLDNGLLCGDIKYNKIK